MCSASVLYSLFTLAFLGGQLFNSRVPSCCLFLLFSSLMDIDCRCAYLQWQYTTMDQCCPRTSVYAPSPFFLPPGTLNRQTHVLLCSTVQGDFSSHHHAAPMDLCTRISCSPPAAQQFVCAWEGGRALKPVTRQVDYPRSHSLSHHRDTHYLTQRVVIVSE